ncbi:protein of unknown function DUF633 [Syntrophobotulus glycolicus DSM 8271]|uniref:SAM-dependent methyltransferase n=1 Tax=Syntrophobotulus glycolicus (strain DSM 8271 / FlGlyR) TaxID=645991 RepID=F0SUX0_SYNGF|nr:class I SAM-dependent methyltransferase [Syntrophobotulus glycolicus]ADY56686.1 protein of unknown function DUF633 [Syntrophobotulus glycolicus DSM 8271]
MNEKTDQEGIRACAPDQMKLGSRLNIIADFIPSGSLLGDIGTDHAYLPVYLLQKGRIEKAIGVDIHKGPFLSAKKTVSQYQLDDRIEIRFGDGLKPLIPGEVNTLSIAGMGGATVLKILQSKPEVLAKVKDLILQPQGMEANVRRELIAQGWRIVEEALVEEEDQIYRIIHFNRLKGIGFEEVREIIKTWEDRLKHSLDDQQDKKILSGFVWMYGPLIMEKREALLKGLIADDLNNILRIAGQMQKTGREEARQKMDRLLKERKILEVMQAWLFQSD